MNLGETLDEFFANAWNAVTALAWSDWLTAVILLVFAVLGYRRGLVKELINIGFLLLALIVAFALYQDLAASTSNTWLGFSNQSQLASAFGVLFVGVIVLKRGLYRFTRYASTLSNPCALNKAMALILLSGLGLVISWHYVSLVSTLGMMEMLVANESMRIGTSLVIIFALLAGALSLLVSTFNISIDTSKSCLLSGLYQGVLNVLKSLDNKLNARNTSGAQNAWLGLVLGLIKGVVLVLVLVLVFQHISWISDHSAWLEAQGLLKTFQEMADGIRPALSQYLTFIEST